MADPTYRTIGNSRTLPEPPGKTIPVLPPDDTAYLCSRICTCNCSPKISSSGRRLYQRCTTLSVRFDCDEHKQVWKYKGEVGYNMINSPPSPIMASLVKNQPFLFPAGSDTSDLDAAIELAKLTGRAQKGLLRIPDVIVVQDMHNFDLSRPNIAFVVEIKFEGDRWRKKNVFQLRDQQRDYVEIAGGYDRVKELSPSICECKPCGESEKVPQGARLPSNAVVPDRTAEVRRMLEPSWQNPAPSYSVRPMADELERGTSSFNQNQVATGMTADGLLILLLILVLSPVGA